MLEIRILVRETRPFRVLDMSSNIGTPETIYVYQRYMIRRADRFYHCHKISRGKDSLEVLALGNWRNKRKLGDIVPAHASSLTQSDS